ncbi:MAG TPA: helix-turn-helix transcriptional regulator [Ruminiclostridium sp.]
MNREDKITLLIKEKYKSVREFSNVSGIPNSTIVSMLKKGLGGTSVDTVLLVCKFLNVSIEEINNTKRQEVSMTADVKELIECYQVCDKDNKEELLMLARLKATKSTTAAGQSQIG